jgi:hypothetical protein
MRQEGLGKFSTLDDAKLFQFWFVLFQIRIIFYVSSQMTSKIFPNRLTYKKEHKLHGMKRCFLN